MRQLLLFCFVALAFSACEKNSNDSDDSNVHPENQSIYGKFRGTFSRTGMDTVNVELDFLDGNRFQGSSDKSIYPAICSGDFTFDGSVLSVNDTCTWTADFDWTLIFDGNYNVAFSGINSVRIWRTNGTFTDEYRLNRLIR